MKVQLRTKILWLYIQQRLLAEKRENHRITAGRA